MEKYRTLFAVVIGLLSAMSAAETRYLAVGGGWGELTRPCRRVATPLLVYNLETDTVDIDVRGNVFEEAPHGLIYCRGGRENLPAGYRLGENNLPR